MLAMYGNMIRVKKKIFIGNKSGCNLINGNIKIIVYFLISSANIYNLCCQ